MTFHSRIKEEFTTIQREDKDIIKYFRKGKLKIKFVAFHGIIKGG